MCDGRRRSNGRVQSGVSDVESVLAFCLLRDSMSVIMAGVTNTIVHNNMPMYQHICHTYSITDTCAMSAH